MKEVKELEFDKEVLKKIEMICRFAYVSPHIITAGKNNYLIFNGSDILFVNDYSKSIKLKDLEVHIKTN